ncbi:MAG: hypothetical protein C4K49_12545 [Candidatus Thorarchaeota archaeon]|nr:MAG: hypothetical protein C4K49_12545 [Candidatus Thorarchaeota archaeon]
MVEDAVASALKYFSSDHNCAQSVFRSLLEQKKLYFNEATKVAAGFGGGIAREGQTCGAVTGAIMAIGVIEGTRVPEFQDHKKATYEIGKRFLDEFREKHNTCICKELIGFDVGDPVQHSEAEKKRVFRDLCTGFVKDAVRIVLDLLPDEPKRKPVH